MSVFQPEAGCENLLRPNWSVLSYMNQKKSKLLKTPNMLLLSAALTYQNNHNVYLCPNKAALNHSVVNCDHKGRFPQNA